MRLKMQRAHTQVLIIVLIVVAFSAMVAACVSAPASPQPTDTPSVITSPTPQPQSTDAANTADGGIASAALGAATAVVAGTPIPTPTPGVIDRGIDRAAATTGLDGKSFLGLAADDWIEAVVAILFILIGFVVIKLIFRLLQLLLNRSDIHRGKVFFQSTSNELQWLLLLLLVRYAVLRLDFLNDLARTTVNDLFFILILLLVTSIVIKLVDAFVDDYQEGLDAQKQTWITPVLTATRRFGQLIVLILAVSIGLSHFGISTNALSATIILVGLIFAIGAKGVVSDAISGFIILTDQPFRVGDAIYIEDLERRGDVLEIGARTTRILTEYNREVIIPNSKIGASEVINYAYPDPSYRLETDLNVRYDADMDQVQQVLTDAVGAVDGVMEDRPVDVLFLAYGAYARSISVRWWIASYEQEWLMLDTVNRVMQIALNNAGIDVPFPKYDFDIKTEDRNAGPTPSVSLDNSSNAMSS